MGRFPTRRRNWRSGVIICLVAIGLAGPSALIADAGSQGTGTLFPASPRLTAAPLAPPQVLALPAVPGTFATALQVDTRNRQAVVDFYRDQFVPGNTVDMQWTGSISACIAGSVSKAYQHATLQRINYYRAMAGVPATVLLESSFSEQAQAAALIMSANNQLSHAPGANWACHSPAGAEGARHANISLGHAGPAAVTGQMQDNGDGNGAVGHRRWLLYPQTRLMGAGSVAGDANRAPAAAIWVFDGNYGMARPAVRDGFVAWPPPGFVPYAVVYSRWSFSYPGADFTQATVHVSRGGSELPVRLESVFEGYGENTLVFVPGNLSTLTSAHIGRPASDTEYQVTVSNVRVGNESKAFSYAVTVIDPEPQTLGNIAITPAEPMLVVGETLKLALSGGSGNYVRAQFSGTAFRISHFAANSLSITGVTEGVGTLTVSDSEGAVRSVRIVVTAALATSGADADRLFDWAERVYSHVLGAGGASQSADTSLGRAYYRHYPASGYYLGVIGGDVYILASGGAFQNLGPLSAWLSRVTP